MKRLRNTFPALSSQQHSSPAVLHTASAPFPEGTNVVLLFASLLLLCAVVFPLSASASTILKAPDNTGLVGYWSFDSNTINSTTVKDLSGKGNNGTLSGSPAPTATQGVINQALSFNGSNDVTLSSIPVNTTAGAQNTVSFWMKWDGTSGVMPFGWSSYDLWFASACFGINTGNSDVLGISSSGLANTWVHVAVVFYNGVPSASNDAIYINGVKQTITQCLSSPISVTVSTSAQISGWTNGGCQRRRDSRPAWRSKSRPVAGRMRRHSKGPDRAPLRAGCENFR